MGDFDKVQTPGAGNDKGKLKILGVLAVVLAGLVIHYLLKGGPQGASASTMSLETDGALLKHEETPAQAQAALAVDPTSQLLRGGAGAEFDANALPRNPFELSARWRATLVPAVAPASRAAAPARPSPMAAPSPISLDAYKLSGVFQQDQHQYAIVNGNILTVGMTLDDLRVVEIGSNTVTFERVDSPNGPRATLTIAPRLK